MRIFLHIGMVIVCLYFMDGCAYETTGASAPTGVVSDAEDTNDPKTEATMTGKIMHIQEDMILVAEAGNGLYQVPIKTLTENMQYLQGGDTVAIGFDGPILEMHPAIIGNPIYIKLLENGEDFVGFYAEVLTHLFETDPGLNDQISFIAVDFTKEENLTSGEKQALLYLLCNKTQVEARMATYEELLAENLVTIHKDTGFAMLDNGLLFHLDAEKMAENKFKFSADKWRSSLGSYSFSDCTAKKENGKWVYTIGAEMIS